jgi:hypothetical protein
MLRTKALLLFMMGVSTCAMARLWICARIVTIVFAASPFPDLAEGAGGIAGPNAATTHAARMGVDVRDFGAKGDGKADDTKAIQAAFDAASRKTWSEQPRDSAYFISIPTVLFPAGKYLVSDTIELKANVQGEGTAILQQKAEGKDILSSIFAWRVQVAGLTLVGGRHQLHLDNPNVDTGRLTVDKCALYNASGTAIRLRQSTNSTQVSIRDCPTPPISYNPTGWLTLRFLRGNRLK